MTRRRITGGAVAVAVTLVLVILLGAPERGSCGGAQDRGYPLPHDSLLQVSTKLAVHALDTQRLACLCTMVSADQAQQLGGSPQATDSKWFALADTAPCDSVQGAGGAVPVSASSAAAQKMADTPADDGSGSANGAVSMSMEEVFCAALKKHAAKHKKKRGNKVMKGNTSFTTDSFVEGAGQDDDTVADDDSSGDSGGDLGADDMDLEELMSSRTGSHALRGANMGGEVGPPVSQLLQMSEQLKARSDAGLKAMVGDTFTAHLQDAPAPWSEAECQCAGPGAPPPAGLAYTGAGSGDALETAASGTSSLSAAVADSAAAQRTADAGTAPVVTGGVSIQFEVHKSMYQTSASDTLDTLIAEADKGDLVCSKDMDSLIEFGSQSTCQGPKDDIAYKTTVTFTLKAQHAFKFHHDADYGRGGTIGVDGQIAKAGPGLAPTLGVDSRSIETDFITLGSGKHNIVFVGFENCCDGNAKITFMLDNEENGWKVLAKESLAEALGADLDSSVATQAGGLEAAVSASAQKTDFGASEVSSMDSECTAAPEYKGWAQFMGRYLVQNQGRAPNLMSKSLEQMEQSPEMAAWITHLKATEGAVPDSCKAHQGANQMVGRNSTMRAGSGMMVTNPDGSISYPNQQQTIGGDGKTQRIGGDGLPIEEGAAVPEETAAQKAAAAVLAAQGGGYSDAVKNTPQVASDPASCFSADLLGQFLSRIFREDLKWHQLGDGLKVEKSCLHWGPWFQSNPKVAQTMINGGEQAAGKMLGCLCPRYAAMIREDEARATAGVGMVGADSGAAGGGPETEEQRVSREEQEEARLAAQEKLWMTKPFSTSTLAALGKVQMSKVEVAGFTSQDNTEFAIKMDEKPGRAPAPA